VTHTFRPLLKISGKRSHDNITRLMTVIAMRLILLSMRKYQLNISFRSTIPRDSILS